MNGETPRHKAIQWEGEGTGSNCVWDGDWGLFFFRKMRKFGRARTAAEAAATQTDAGTGSLVQTLLCCDK